MVTRVYLPSTGAAAVSPAVHASWGVSTNLTRRQGVTARISSTMTEFDGLGDASTTTQVVQQYVIGPLAAQNVSGTIKGQVRIRRANASGDPGRMAVAIQCVDSAGANALALLAPTHSTQTGTPPNLNAIDTATNRSFEEGNADYNLNLTAQDVPAGGYMVVEIGYKDDTANAARFVRFTFGDDSATDLAEDRTTTTADNPWIEFSQTLTFSGGGTTNSKTVNDTLSVTDSTSQYPVRGRTTTESLTISELLSRIAYRNRMSSDTVTITEEGVYKELAYSFDDAISINETISRTAYHNRLIAESISIAELITGLILSGGNINTKVITDAITIIDSLTRVAMRNRLATDTAAITESISRSIFRNRQINDQIDVLETLIGLYVADPGSVLYNIRIKLGVDRGRDPLLGANVSMIPILGVQQ